MATSTPGPSRQSVRRILVRHPVFKAGLVLLAISIVLLLYGTVSPKWGGGFLGQTVGLWQFCEGSLCYNSRALHLDKWYYAVRALIVIADILFWIAVFVELYQDVYKSRPPPPENKAVEVILALAVVIGITGLTIFGVEWTDKMQTNLQVGFYLTAVGCWLGTASAIAIFYSRRKHAAYVDRALAMRGIIVVQPGDRRTGSPATAPASHRGSRSPPGSVLTPYQQSSVFPTAPLLEPSDGGGAQASNDRADASGVPPNPSTADAHPPSYESAMIQFPPASSSSSAPLPPTVQMGGGGALRPASGAYSLPPSLDVAGAPTLIGGPRPSSGADDAPPSSCVPDRPVPSTVQAGGVPRPSSGTFDTLPSSVVPPPVARSAAPVPGTASRPIPLYFIMVDGHPVPVYDQPPA